MRAFLARLTFQQRLEGLVAVSTVLVLGFSGYLLYGSWQAAAEATSISALTRLAVATSGAVHELQKERGRSSGFLGSKGQQFASELTAQRTSADRAIEALDTTLRGMPGLSERVRAQMADAGRQRAGLASIRERVTAQSVTGPEAIGFYSAVIASYLTAVDQMALVPSRGDLVRQLVAYANFLQAKEQAGQERAVLSNAFGANRFSPVLYKSFAGIVSAEQTRMALFRTHARPEDVQAFQQTVSGADVAQAAAWRDLAFEKASEGGFGIDPAAWFAAATKRIDLMKQVEDGLSNDIVTAAARAQHGAERSLALVLAATIGALLFGVGGAVVLGRMTSRALSNVASELSENAGQVAAAARQVAASAQSLAQGSTEQAASLEETSASMEEMASMTHRNSDHAAAAARLVDGMSAQVEASNVAISEMVDSMRAIKESSARVGHIIKTIDEIAFQTNILALNAAVEAARAGAAGMGFAVVADEVRTLAQRSSQAAKDTASLIEESIQRSSDGARRVDEVTTAIAAITTSVTAVTRIVEDVREASRQQTSGIDQVAQALAQMEKVTQSTAATAEEGAAASEELNAQAECSLHVIGELRELVHGTGQAVRASEPVPAPARGIHKRAA